MFTQEHFGQLGFLEGRWVGTGPDGKPFYEQYAFTGSAEFKSMRFKDERFAEQTDSSTVALRDDVITSTWGDFTWRASSIEPDKACFDPLNAPSAFCWERVSADVVEVTQRWTDDKGQPQTYVVQLRRL